MAVKDKPVEEVVVQPVGVRVVAIKHKMRHPVTNILFMPGRPVDIIDLESPENAFVRHQLEAGIFKQV